MMTTPILPDPIAAYFAADKHGIDAIARCFTTQAVVKDEGQTNTGLEAIKATSEPFALEQKEGSCIVTSRVTGNFPGSPVDLRYRFRLERGLIASLEITA